MSSYRARRDDHEQLDAHLGAALTALKQYAESPATCVATLEQALSALRRALIHATRVAYRLAESPYGSSDMAALKWARERAEVADQNRVSASQKSIDELILISSKYSLRSAVNERPYLENPGRGYDHLAPQPTDARRN
jgi:hypothetical protein